jgi:hypothetical protein
VAKQHHHPGEQVTLDYGRHPLQHKVYQYGFVPGYGTEGAMYEVFEDFGSIWEVLIVQGSPQVSISHCAAPAAQSFPGSPALDACCTQLNTFSISVVSLPMHIMLPGNFCQSWCHHWF